MDDTGALVKEFTFDEVRIAVRSPDNLKAIANGFSSILEQVEGGLDGLLEFVLDFIGSVVASKSVPADVDKVCVLFREYVLPLVGAGVLKDVPASLKTTYLLQHRFMSRLTLWEPNILLADRVVQCWKKDDPDANACILGCGDGIPFILGVCVALADEDRSTTTKGTMMCKNQTSSRK